MKKLLIITYYWPPSGGAGVQRWLKFTKYLPEYGWEPIIYTPENPEAPATDESLMNDVSEKLTVIKRPIREPYSIYKMLVGQKQNEKINAGFLSENKKTGWIQKSAAWIRGNLFIPDARKFWVTPSVKFLSDYISRNPVHAIASSGPPHSMHLIALGLKKSLNIPWLADFRDPWTGIDFYKDLHLTSWADRKHHKMEKQVLTSADRVITVGERVAKELNDIGRDNVHVVTNGFDPADFPSVKTQEISQFSILHVGAINKDRNHTIFWKVVSDLKSAGAFEQIPWQIKIVGKADFSVLRDIEKFNLEQNVEIVPYLPHEEVVKMEKEAAVLYLSINNTPGAQGILTGKIFEYLAARRPILAIGPTDGEVAEVLKKTGAGLISGFDDQPGLAENIRKLLDAYKTSKLIVESTGIDQYSRKQLTSNLSTILNDMLT